MPQPEIGPGDVLVRVRACGICGSDVHGMDGSTGRRIPPLVMGHEAAGVIEEAGAEREELEARRPGHVRFHRLLRASATSAAAARSTCATTARCWAFPAAITAGNGAFAEYVAVPQNILYRCPMTCPSSTPR